MYIYIGEIAEKTPSVDPAIKSEKIDALFKTESDIQGIVVTTRNWPVGLVMKSHFYQNIGKKFGFDLFMGRSIELLMNDKPLVVDYFEKITTVSSLAMSRNPNSIYDFIIVINDGKYFGTVSIQSLLTKLAEIQINQAKFTNPLTGLPGNSVIEEQLTTALGKQEYSILYIDLDYFKTYNDTYGFKQGDELLRETSKILNENLSDENFAFLGHIGGDDFIIVLHHHYYEEVCKTIIHDFDNNIKYYYHQEDYDRGYVYSENRNGLLEDIPIVNISIAVITNKYRKYHSITEVAEQAAKIKKLCKENKKSCFSSTDDMPLPCC